MTDVSRQGRKRIGRDTSQLFGQTHPFLAGLRFTGWSQPAYVCASNIDPCTAAVVHVAVRGIYPVRVYAHSMWFLAFVRAQGGDWPACVYSIPHVRFTRHFIRTFDFVCTYMWWTAVSAGSISALASLERSTAYCVFGPSLPASRKGFHSIRGEGSLQSFALKKCITGIYGLEYFSRWVVSEYGCLDIYYELHML